MLRKHNKISNIAGVFQSRKGESNMSTSAAPSTNGRSTDAEFVDAVVVGAGFAGMYMLHRLRALGLTTRVIEAGSGVGGTWYWNRYPGARCDTESVEYSYSFSDEIQQKWEWSERYPAQPEILRYAEYVADKLDLKRSITFNTRVVSAEYSEASNQWIIETDGGSSIRAQFCIMATGCLSATQLPKIEGVESFQRDWYHTGQWPQEGVDFTGQRVGIIGTGSSAIQSIPIIADQAEHLYVFQRTPNYSVPAHNGELDPAHTRWIKENYDELRSRARHSRRGYIAEINPVGALEVGADDRRAEYERRWATGGLGYLSSFNNLLSDSEANATAAEFVRERIREIVNDPDTAETLLPRDYPIGTKRLCIDTGYFETYNRDNVTLVNLKSTPISRITPTGLRTTENEYELDSLVFATGFDAMTGTLSNIDIRGRNGLRLRDRWSEGPVTYLGLAIAGFPNLFTITGPGSPSVLSNMIVSIEQHVEWIAECIDYMGKHELGVVEATREAEVDWTEHVNDVAASMLLSQGNSWWKGANIPGKPVVFMPYAGGVGRYREICDEVAGRGYIGFNLARAGARINQQ
jgi:cyclohexanone monooxygenase